MSSTTASNFSRFGLEHDVLEVLADHRPVRGHDRHVEVVDLRELGRLGVGGAGHAAELAVHAEEVLERDRRERLVLAADRDPLLRLDRLVQPVGPAPAGHHAARELVDDHHLGPPVLALAHHVVDVAPLERVRQSA